MDIFTYDKPLLLTTTDFGFFRTDDCACPESPFTIKSQTSKNNIHISRPDNLHIQLSDKFHLLFSPYSPISPSVVNNIAYQRYQQFQKPQPLSQEIDYQLSEQNLITPTESQPTIQNNPIEQLTAWLHITNACNLDCPYCYIKKSSASMDETIAKNSINQLFQTAQSQGFKTIKLKYAGGEAILHFKLIKTIHEYASQLAEQTQIKLQEVILSNGTLINPEIAQWLAQTQIKLMISIDGLHEIHDQQRYSKQGKPSFQTIEHNINHYLRPVNVKPTICVTVTKNNAAYMAELMQWILHQGFHFTLNFY